MESRPMPQIGTPSHLEPAQIRFVLDKLKRIIKDKSVATKRRRAMTSDHAGEICRKPKGDAGRRHRLAPAQMR
ncbi:hypothetical protein CEW83_00335 [Parazoarcus communis]|uniref:Uncharacterized protein n=1 Tax=Parazoarcus communis TaxID=41977 RepID=A0A2U8GK51_9RHOO|nr:hypothetical protein CEW83_00335 [Parazoarcus communis]